MWCFARVVTLLLLAGPVAAAPAVRVSVDASEAPRHILHTRLVLPVKAGPLTLVYPKWIPGEHAPTGPIEGMAGLHLTTRGHEIPCSSAYCSTAAAAARAGPNP